MNENKKNNNPMVDYYYELLYALATKVGVPVDDLIDGYAKLIHIPPRFDRLTFSYKGELIKNISYVLVGYIDGMRCVRIGCNRGGGYYHIAIDDENIFLNTDITDFIIKLLQLFMFDERTIHQLREKYGKDSLI